MNIDEFVPLEIDPEKAEEILSKVKKTLRNFTLSTGRNFAVLSKDALSDQKYHKNYLELKEEGLALDELVQDAQKSIVSSDTTTVFPKFINTRYIDTRFDIFTRHSPLISNCTEINFDTNLKPGQIVAYLSGENLISVGMIAPKVDDDIYRVFNLSKEYEYELVKINDIYPFPAVFPKKYDASTIGLQSGTKIFIMQNDQSLDRTKCMILKGTILKFDETSANDQIKYDAELEDNQHIVVKAQFITKQESPFHIKDEEGAKARIQELINQGIDQLALLDPKEAKKYKISVAKKNKQKRRQEGLEDDNESTQEVDEEGRPVQKKKQRKELGPVRHSPRTRTMNRLSYDISESTADQQTTDDENENENEQQEENVKEEQQYPSLNQQQVAPTFSNNLFQQPLQPNQIYQYPQRCHYLNYTSFSNQMPSMTQGMPINLQNAQLGPLTNQRQPYQFSQQLYQSSQLNEQPTPITMPFIQPAKNQSQQMQTAYIQPITLPQLTPPIEKKLPIVNQQIPISEIQQSNIVNEQNSNVVNKQILFEQNQKSDNSLNKIESQTTVQMSTQNDNEQQSPEN